MQMFCATVCVRLWERKKIKLFPICIEMALSWVHWAHTHRQAASHSHSHTLQIVTWRRRWRGAKWQKETHKIDGSLVLRFFFLFVSFCFVLFLFLFFFSPFHLIIFIYQLRGCEQIFLKAFLSCLADEISSSRRRRRWTTTKV